MMLALLADEWGRLLGELPWWVAFGIFLATMAALWAFVRSKRPMD